MKELSIPLLTEQDIDCRVQSVSKAKTGRVGAVILLYKDARVDMRILDQVFGPSNWQRTHEVINGNLFCNIDIWDDEKKTWVRKQDVGTESNTEKEKGQASDSFKRAGFNVGIGRELYTGPFIYVELADGEFYPERQGQKEVFKCYASTKFKVSKIAYNDRREICDLVIVDRNNKVRFNMNGHAPAPQATQSATNGQNAQGGQSTNQQQRTAPQPQNSAQTGGAACPVCGGPISEAERRYSMNKFGREICVKGGVINAQPHFERINMYVGKSGVLIGGSRSPFLSSDRKSGRLRPVLRKPENPCFPSLSAERTDRKEGVFLAG